MGVSAQWRSICTLSIHMPPFSTPAGRAPAVREITIAGTLVRERRQNVRFPMELPVRYRVGKSSSWGKIVNIGSGGALFTTDNTLKRGQRVELYIGWPVLLHEKIHLNLIAEGLIVRLEDGRAAVRFERCSFRTASAAFRRHALFPEVFTSAESHC
jgi:hypothetical protein